VARKENLVTQRVGAAESCGIRLHGFSAVVKKNNRARLVAGSTGEEGPGAEDMLDREGDRDGQTKHVDAERTRRRTMVLAPNEFVIS